MGYRKCMLVLLLGAVLAGCNYFVDQTTLAANPWCDHPIRCFDYEEELAASVAPDTDPCDNLYEHVCDNWDRNHPSLVHDSSQIHMLQFRITAFLMGALKQAPPASSPASVTKAVRGFQQCIKVFDDERDDLKVLLDVFKKFTLHWPSANFSSDFDTLDFLVGVSLEYGLSTPFSLTLVPYLKTDSRYGLLLTMNIPSTNDGFEDVTVIEQCISKVAPWARSQEVSTVAGSIVAGFQDFISLYYLLYPGPYVALEFRTLEQMTNGSYEYWTLEDWLRVVNKHLPKDRQIDKDEQVLVYMNSDTALGDVLRSNPARHVTLVQYAAWSIIVQLYGGVSKDLVECVPPHLPPQLKSAVNCLGLANKAWT
ncbi:hypothetical protein HPB48_011963 [Haemaphysalis longicornis]|uniref:Peptidase M13 N-terminal domain-containing protein n=1 Tax=Haemaphysalis longicornis TaxID=44386 RepID=A0A9J6GM61_HAELO|nr:hypothetical protein HPB48_011963 [Haemaphysalis longicornis]